MAPAWLGSISRHAQAELGGQRLVAGDVLTIASCRQLEGSVGDARAVPRPAGVDDPISRARVVLGPQQRFFDSATIETLLSTSFRPSASFDRMGLVLDGPAIPPIATDMPSEPITRGALQVNGDARPCSKPITRQPVAIPKSQ